MSAAADIRSLRKYNLQKNGEKKKLWINKYHFEKLAENPQKVRQ